MKFAVIVFPGSNCDIDTIKAIEDVLEKPVDAVWHHETDLSAYDCIFLPGGFSYGDYLRTGAIARFSPVMEQVKKAAEEGKWVVGICNGFQILTEAGLLPGALQRNVHLQFRCAWTHLRVENIGTPYTADCREGQVLKVPVNHGEGNYFADPQTLAELNANRQIVFRYCDPDGNVTGAASPNGSLENIAGIINKQGNVMGMMPHPERASELILGSADGLHVFRSMVNYLTGRRAHV